VYHLVDPIEQELVEKLLLASHMPHLRLTRGVVRECSGKQQHVGQAGVMGKSHNEEVSRCAIAVSVHFVPHHLKGLNQSRAQNTSL
jgi:hypothetical protein